MNGLPAKEGSGCRHSGKRQGGPLESPEGARPSHTWISHFWPREPWEDTVSGFPSRARAHVPCRSYAPSPLPWHPGSVTRAHCLSFLNTSCLRGLAVHVKALSDSVRSPHCGGDKVKAEEAHVGSKCGGMNVAQPRTPPWPGDKIPQRTTERGTQVSVHVWGPSGSRAQSRLDVGSGLGLDCQTPAGERRG